MYGPATNWSWTWNTFACEKKPQITATPKADLPIIGLRNVPFRLFHVEKLVLQVCVLKKVPEGFMELKCDNTSVTTWAWWHGHFGKGTRCCWGGSSRRWTFLLHPASSRCSCYRRCPSNQRMQKTSCPGSVVVLSEPTASLCLASPWAGLGRKDLRRSFPARGHVLPLDWKSLERLLPSPNLRGWARSVMVRLGCPEGSEEPQIPHVASGGTWKGCGWKPTFFSWGGKLQKKPWATAGWGRGQVSILHWLCL